MKEGDVQSANDEDEDIYKDIGDFRYDRELTKLEESNKAYSEDVARLSERINELTERNETLERVNEILVTNISILLKTAKAELDRKQLVIDDIRQKLESSNKRHGRNERISSLRSGSCRKSPDEVVAEHCKMVDVEEGEILGDDGEEKKSNPDERRSDGSNSRDRGYHSSSHRKRQDSHERSKTRSNDSSSSRRKSRYPDDNYSRHSSSSRNHHRTSPDGRGHTDKRKSSDKTIHSSRSSHSHSSRSRKNSPDRKEQSSRKSRERRRSITKTDSEKLKKEGSTDRGREEQSNKHDCLNGNKSKTVKPSGTKKEKKEVESEENCSVAKTIGISEYRLRKSGDGSSQKKSECISLARQSVLADLYDEPSDSKTLTEIPKRTTDEQDRLEPENEDEAGNRCDLPSANFRNQLKTKDSQVVKAPKTLYSRRMEAKFQQQQLLENAIIKKGLESLSEKQLDKGKPENAQQKPEETDKVDIQVEKITEVVEVMEKDSEVGDNKETPQTGVEEAVKADCTAEAATETVSESIQSPTEGNPNESLGESLEKKLLQLQTLAENVGITEFSPLKNNYKLSKISPLKPVSKQHILEYYNLKPSSQQLPNIEPEVLDFSFPLPETPGKNFFNSFLPLNDTKESASNHEENDGSDKCTENNGEEAGDTKSGCESGIDDLLTVAKPSRTRKKNGKTGKISNTTDEASSKPVQTSDEDIGQGKSYKTRYHMRTRSKTENGKSNPNETDDLDEKCGSRNGSEGEGGVKRERRLTLSDDADLGVAPKRMKCETPKTENEPSIEVTAEGTVPDDITSFEVFRSVSDENIGNISALVQEATRVEEKSGVDELPSWNGGEYTANKTASNEEETPEMEGEKVKPLLSSTGNSGDSSNFKVLRSYLMLSANDDTDDEDFCSDGNSTGSGEYSDSGASALVDLL